MIVPFALLGMACGGAGSAGVVPDGGPTAAVEDFMAAVADSNLARMAELWGTNQGSAAATGSPTGYERRIQIMQLFLGHSTAEVIAMLERSDDRVVLAVNVTRENCRRQVPFTTVKTRDGRWLVNNIELSAAGTPGAPCPMENRVPPA